jgi:hypothetical protein
MTTADELERALISDLEKLGDRFADEKFCHELYRSLTRQAWFKDGLDGHVALSFKRTEEIVNGLRERLGREPLALAQTGGEGQVDSTVAEALGPLGWRHRPLDTSEHDDYHVDSPEDPPPPSRERQAPDWEREGHAEAEQNRGRVTPVPPPG